MSRIERGEVDPGVVTLSRLLEACGQHLELDSHPTRPAIALLSDAWRTGPNGSHRPDWTRLRSFVDHLTLHPQDRAIATAAAPPPSGSAVMDNVLAALAETISDEAGLPTPGWVAHIRPLNTLWEPPGTPRMTAAAAATTPTRFAERGITLGRDALWRDRTLDAAG